MKSISMLGLLVLLGGGCPVSAPPSMGVAPTDGARPPEIRMYADGAQIAGVEGSYCFEGRCVDKIGPPDLVREAGLAFAPVPHVPMHFAIDAQVSSMNLELMNSSGSFFQGAGKVLQPDAQGNYPYAPPETLSGDYYVLVMAQFAEGGDVSYVFPVRFE